MRAAERKSRKFAKQLRRRMTDAERILWSRLRRKSFDGENRFRRQHPIGPYIADFACVKGWLVVEVDGDTHEIEYDRCRDAFMRKRGWRVLRVTNLEIYKNLDGVLEGIGRALPLPGGCAGRRAPSVTPALRYGVPPPP